MKSSTSKLRRSRWRGAAPFLRRGVAATELAVCLPLLTLIVVATIEAASLLYLQQSLSIACYEAARVALVPEATSANAKYQAELILNARGVKNYQVSVYPTNVDLAADGTWIRIGAEAPFGRNSLMGGWLFKDRQCSADVEMIKER